MTNKRNLRAIFVCVWIQFSSNVLRPAALTSSMSLEGMKVIGLCSAHLDLKSLGMGCRKLFSKCPSESEAGTSKGASLRHKRDCLSNSSCISPLYPKGIFSIWVPFYLSSPLKFLSSLLPLFPSSIHLCLSVLHFHFLFLPSFTLTSNCSILKDTSKSRTSAPEFAS